MLFLYWIPKPHDVDQVTLEADVMNVLVSSSLLIPPDASGSLPLFSGPQSIHRTLSKHLVSERLIIEELPGQATKRKWVRRGSNHYLDATVYAFTALLRLAWMPDCLEARRPIRPKKRGNTRHISPPIATGISRGSPDCKGFAPRSSVFLYMKCEDLPGK